MKKVGVTAVLFSMLLGLAAVNCGDPCGDLATKMTDCCKKTITGTDAVSKSALDACIKLADAVKDQDSSACSDANDAYSCPAAP